MLRNRLFFSIVIQSKVTLAGGGDIFLMSLYHPFIRLHDSCTRDGSYSSKYSIATTYLYARIFATAYILALIFYLGRHNSAWYLTKLYHNDAYVITSFQVSSKTHVFHLAAHVVSFGIASLRLANNLSSHFFVIVSVQSGIHDSKPLCHNLPKFGLGVKAINGKIMVNIDIHN